ncbi:MAG: hypothetical protein ACLP8Y_07020 [Thermoplasmata archaeon]
MAAAGEPPIEWVSAGTRWWVVRIVIPVIILAIALTVFIVGVATAPSWAASTTHQVLLDGFIVCALAVDLYCLSAFPSVRRIGISPKWLIVDVGYRKFRNPWDDLHQIIRTRESRFRWYQVSSVSRTRISVGSGFPSFTVTLSPQQGERLAQFLRIP